MLPILDRITYYPRRGTPDDPSYVEFTYRWVGGKQSTVGFFRQWNQIWYRHEKDCS